MADRRKPLPEEPDRGRPRGRRRTDVRAPPELSCHALAFPWASSLAVGWGAPDRLPPDDRRAPAATRRTPGRARGTEP